MVKKVWAPIVSKTCGIRTIEVVCIEKYTIFDKQENREITIYKVKNKTNDTFIRSEEYVWDTESRGREPTKEERKSLSKSYKENMGISKENCKRRAKAFKL